MLLSSLTCFSLPAITIQFTSGVFASDYDPTIGKPCWMYRLLSMVHSNPGSYGGEGVLWLFIESCSYI